MAPTPAKLRGQAARERVRAQQAISRAEVLERAADELERLHVAPIAVTSNRRMTPESARTKPGRRGPELRSTGPVAAVARAAGVSMFEIAERIGVPYSTVKAWDQRKSVPAKYRSVLAAVGNAK